jgi:hypothetical protein
VTAPNSVTSSHVNRSTDAEQILSKVPAVTLSFWVIKVLATTLGETGGDTVSMTMNLGYLIGTAIFLGALVVLVIAQIATKKFHPLLYWATIIASTTAGTTMADFADRSLGVGYPGASLILFACVMASLAAWYWSEGTVSVQTGDYHLLANARHGVGRLDCGRRPWLSGRRTRLWRSIGRCGGTLFLDQHFPRDPFLDCLYPHSPVGCHRWRFLRQASGARRPKRKPSACLGHSCRHNHRLHSVDPTTSGRASNPAKLTVPSALCLSRRISEREELFYRSYECADKAKLTHI